MRLILYQPPKKTTDVNRTECGQSLVEMAVILPIMIILISFVLDLSWAFHVKMQIQQLAAEIHKIKVMRATSRQTGGLPQYSIFNTEHETQLFLESNNSLLKQDDLEVTIKEALTLKRPFIRKDYRRINDHKVYVGDINFNNIQPITINVSYNYRMKTLLGRTLIGDVIKLSAQYRAPIHTGTDVS